MQYLIYQFLPNKHHSGFGTKAWVTADSQTAYVVECYVYEGQSMIQQNW